MSRCFYAKDSGKSCGCQNNEKLIECVNAERIAALNKRFDAARNHAKKNDGRVFIRERYCDASSCVDFTEGGSEMDQQCKHATRLERRWVTNASCVVVECRNRRALDDPALSFVDEKGRVWDVGAIRKPCDEYFRLIPDPDCLHIRSRFCNKDACKYFET